MKKFGQEVQGIKRRRIGDLVKEQYIMQLDDGYQVSIIWGPLLTYGGEDGLWEMAICNANREPVYDVDDDIFFGDVIGYLTEEQVAEHLATLKERHAKK